MNANELADILQQSDFLAMDFAEDAATMLRTIPALQAEIEALKADNQKAYAYIAKLANDMGNTRQGAKMTKLKPYGYVMKFESGIEAFNAEEYELPSDKRISSIPLYTHPVKEHFEGEPQAEELHEIMQSNAELTDEEMMKAEYEFMYWNRSLDKPLVEIAYELGVFKQAVAILKKAQKR